MSGRNGDRVRSPSSDSRGGFRPHHRQRISGHEAGRQHDAIASASIPRTNSPDSWIPLWRLSAPQGSPNSGMPAHRCPPSPVQPDEPVHLPHHMITLVGSLRRTKHKKPAKPWITFDSRDLPDNLHPKNRRFSGTWNDSPARGGGIRRNLG